MTSQLRSRDVLCFVGLFLGFARLLKAGRLTKAPDQTGLLSWQHRCLRPEVLHLNVQTLLPTHRPQLQIEIAVVPNNRATNRNSSRTFRTSSTLFHTLLQKLEGWGVRLRVSGYTGFEGQIHEAKRKGLAILGSSKFMTVVGQVAKAELKSKSAVRAWAVPATKKAEVDTWSKLKGNTGPKSRPHI